MQMAEQSPTGVVFLNPGTLPRAALGDSAVYWADSFAASGYPSFRFDLPGLGDSGGDLPTDLMDFQSAVNRGDYAPILSATTQTLVERFELRGVVVVGLCAGAVTALFAAAADNRIKGLILMDPYFNEQQDVTSRSLLSRWHMRVIRGIEEDWQRSVPSGSRLGTALFLKLRGIHKAMKRVRVLPSGNALPSNANLALLRSWQQVVSSGRRILVFSSRSSVPRAGAFDYVEYLLAKSDRGDGVAAQLIDDTNHSFAEGQGKQAVRRHAGEWLRVNFPLSGGGGSRAAERDVSRVAECSGAEIAAFVPTT